MDIFFRSVGIPISIEREPVPRHPANAGGAGRGRRAPARPIALPFARRAGRARQAAPRPV